MTEQLMHEYGERPTYPHPTEEPMARDDVYRRFQGVGATVNEADALADEPGLDAYASDDLLSRLDAYRLAGNIDLDNLTIPKVTEWVGSDPERAKVVADLEAQRAKPRAGVQSVVEKVADAPAPEPAADEPAGEPEPVPSTVPVTEPVPSESAPAAPDTIVPGAEQGAGE